MVFHIDHSRALVWYKKSFAIAIIACIPIFAIAEDKPDPRLMEILTNTVPISIIKEGKNESAGVAIFLGTADEYALLFLPAHLLIAINEIGQPDSRYIIELKILNRIHKFDYKNTSVYLSSSSLLDAVANDYMILKLPIEHKMRGVLFNLDPKIFRTPERNDSIYTYGKNPDSGWTSNSGEISGISGGDVTTFQIRTDKVIQQGDSGSLILGKDYIIHGMLSSSDGQIGYVIFPEKELENAFRTIANAKVNRQDFLGVSFASIPTFQYYRETRDLGNGLSNTTEDYGYYTGLEMELFWLNMPLGSTSSQKIGIITGYSPGNTHGLGHVNDAEYTLKYGIALGAIDRYENNTGQLGIFILSHRRNDEFIHKLGVSFEATYWQFVIGNNHSLDLGLRLEVNKMSLSSFGGGAMSAGVLLKYNWIPYN